MDSNNNMLLQSSFRDETTSVTVGTGLLHTLSLACQAAKGFATTPLNFQNPFVVRKWLNHLRPDPLSIIRIKPNLRLSKKTLGFSFASNSLGLRGPETRGAENVIFGTSYAMGFGVDNGTNWYELCLDPNQWINLALPVGPRQQHLMLDAYHRGHRRRALVLYFANFFPYAMRFDAFCNQETERDVFEYFRWRRHPKDCTRVLCKLPFKIAKALYKKQMLLLKTRCGVHLLNLSYGTVHRKGNEERFDTVVSVWKKMLRSFDSVYIFRVPSKNETAASVANVSCLNSQRAILDDNWNFFRSGLECLDNVATQDLSLHFDMKDFLLWDNHYNERGNRKLARYISSALDIRKGKIA